MSIHSLITNKNYPYKKVLEKLIAHRVNKDVPRVLAHLDEEISEEDLLLIQKSYHSYAVDKQPLEYILGYVEFLGYQFTVNKHTLIPRPETEYMIEAVVKELRGKRSEIWQKKSNTRVKRTEIWNQISNNRSDLWSPYSVLIDVGTGCGVLGLSCILHGADYLDQVYLTEYYPETLEVARGNLEQKKSEIGTKRSAIGDRRSKDKSDLWSQVSNLLDTTQLIHCSLLDHPVLKEILQKKKEFWDLRSDARNKKLEIGDIISNDSSDLKSPISDLHKVIIVANLPYIPEQLFEDNVEDNVKLREPKPAFVGGEDGLDWYREMLTQIINYRLHTTQETTNHKVQTIDASVLKYGVWSLKLFLEMMTRQVDILRKEFENHFSFEEVATFHMNIRIVKARLID